MAWITLFAVFVKLIKAEDFDAIIIDMLKGEKRLND